MRPPRSQRVAAEEEAARKAAEEEAARAAAAEEAAPRRYVQEHTTRVGPAAKAAAAAALRQAAAEGLTLERSSKNATGFKCVARVTGSSNMFAARAPGGRLSRFRTAEEAALCLARYLRDAAAGGVVHAAADVHAVAQASAAEALWQVPTALSQDTLQLALETLADDLMVELHHEE